ncbi:cyclic GMP-AMP synthase-like receptor 1 [Musca vetustissima]|uniref:cyclic GMP-AMP synthase-like receptor 1 n=1 Tax=Musca vetustissima TaxID=27455 RepID=UPI002AB717B6|nr:cyclic GMP-AMP synthase-like receptor 1 [Musca vetustissima]
MECIDKVFKRLHRGEELFGSYSNGVRLLSPSEFDIFIVLKFPFALNARPDSSRPGFVHFPMTTTMNTIRNDYNNRELYDLLEQIVDWRTGCLSTAAFKEWMFDLIEQAVERCKGYFFDKGLSVVFQRHAVAFNLYIKDLNYQDVYISIDVVPAIKLGKHSWMQVRYDATAYDDSDFCNFMAVAKRGSYRPRRTFACTFMMVNPTSEQNILWDKQNLKPVMRLLKSLRDKLELNRLKSCFITHLLLWEVDKQPLEFWRKPIGYLFTYMLWQLCNCFNNGKLSYFWHSGCNLLDILKPHQKRRYTQELNDAYRTMKTFLERPNLSYDTVESFFDVPYETDYDSETEYEDDSETDYDYYDTE